MVNEWVYQLGLWIGYGYLILGADNHVNQIRLDVGGIEKLRTIIWIVFFSNYSRDNMRVRSFKENYYTVRQLASRVKYVHDAYERFNTEKV